MLLVSLLLVGGVVGLLMFNTSMQQTSFAAARLEERAVALSAEEQALTQEVESLRNPQRVAEQAQAIGMVLPTASCFLVLGGTQPECAPAPPPESLRLQPQAPVKPAILDPDPITVPAPEDTAGGGQDASSERGKNRQDTGSASPQGRSGRDRNGATTDRDRARR